TTVRGRAGRCPAGRSPRSFVVRSSPTGGACLAAPATVGSLPARWTRRCSGVPSADGRLTDLGAPDSSPALADAPHTRSRGLLAWRAVCAVFTVLDLTGLLDGLLVPVPLILALVFARVVRPESGWEHASRLVAAVIAAACVPAAAVVWRFGISLGTMSPL